MTAQHQARIHVALETRDRGRIARVTVENERKLNTLDGALMDSFAEQVDALAAHDDLRLVILGGAGPRAFIGGADINEMARLTPVTARAFITRLHRCCESLRNLPVPVIGRLHGITFGGGLEIAAACDFRIAADNAVFGMPEVKLGIPSVIEAALLPMLVGWGRARQILMTGAPFTAAEALQWGFVERVVPEAGLDAGVEDWVASLLTSAPRAVRLQKSLMRSWEDLPLRAAIQAGVDAFVESWRTDEPKDAMQDFLDRQAARKAGR